MRVSSKLTLILDAEITRELAKAKEADRAATAKGFKKFKGEQINWPGLVLGLILQQSVRIPEQIFGCRGCRDGRVVRHRRRRGRRGSDDQVRRVAYRRGGGVKDSVVFFVLVHGCILVNLASSLILLSVKETLLAFRDGRTTVYYIWDFWECRYLWRFPDRNGAVEPRPTLHHSRRLRCFQQSPNTIEAGNLVVLTWAPLL